MYMCMYANMRAHVCTWDKNAHAGEIKNKLSTHMHMHMYVYVYVYLYANVCEINKSTHMHIHMYVYVHVCICAHACEIKISCLRICVCRCMYMSMHLLMYVYVYVYLHAYVCEIKICCLRIRSCMCMYMCMYTYMHADILIRTYFYTWLRNLKIAHFPKCENAHFAHSAHVPTSEICTFCKIWSAHFPKCAHFGKCAHIFWKCESAIFKTLAVVTVW